MPRFRRVETTFDLAPAGVYAAQVVKARQTISKSNGNEMITLTLKTVSGGYLLPYYLVFNNKDGNDGLITQFCDRCEGQLTFPEDDVEYSLTAADCLHRIVYVEVSHEPILDRNNQETGEHRAVVSFGKILSRAKAIARAPELEPLKLPANVPPPKPLAVMPAEKPLTNSALGFKDLDSEPDDIPF